MGIADVAMIRASEEILENKPMRYCLTVALSSNKIMNVSVKQRK